MSNVTTTAWTCDRCGHTEETLPSSQPITWGRLIINRPPNAAETAIHNHTFGDICQSCRNSLDAWWGQEADR